MPKTRQQRMTMTQQQTHTKTHLSSSLWIDELEAVAPADRRLALYALRLHRTLIEDKSHILLQRGASDDDDFLALLLPLVDLECVAQWAQQHARELDPDTLDLLTRWNGTSAFGIDTTDLKRLMRRLLSTRRGIMARLDKADDRRPVEAVTRLLVECLSLDAIDAQVLDYLYHHHASEVFRRLLRKSLVAPASANGQRLAQILAVPAAELAARLSAQAPLRRLGLLEYSAESDLEDFLRPSELLQQVHEAAPACEAALLALLIEPAPAPAWTLDDFPHLADQLPHLGSVLAIAAQTRRKGINALFYGEPGTGKTELARSLAAAHGLDAYQVKSSDGDGDGLSRAGRLSAYQMAQRLLARRPRSVLIFDEVEDIFESGLELFAFLGTRPRGREKGWTNRLLEENPVPAIWITNATEVMDPAFLRRFLLPVAFHTPPRSVRRQMAARHLTPFGVSASLLDQLAGDGCLTPAQLGAASELLQIRADSDPDAVARHTIGAQRTLLHGAPMPRRRTPAMTFDPAFLNLDGELSPAQLQQALKRTGRGTLCFYGPPGTGKTQFAEVLADALDRELVARRASDLVSAYVGQTERNLSRMFRQTDAERTILLLDEVDSFLTDRSQARHQWERAQVNELLQQLEQYPGIFIAATNRMEGLDQAALRRFDIKLQFKALAPAQRRALFAREVYGDAAADVPALIGRRLDALAQLTAGDVATVCRQQALLGEPFRAEQFLRRLVAECRLKRDDGMTAA